MDQNGILNLLDAIRAGGIRVDPRRGWVEFQCPMAPWTHANGIDRSPSAGININPAGASGWHCWACKRKGTVHSLVAELGARRHENYTSLLSSIRDQESRAGLWSDFGRYEDLAGGSEVIDKPLEESVYIGLWPWAWDVPEARRYLRGRNICASTSETLELVYDEDQGRILFPVRDRDGLLWGFSGRAIRPDVEPKIRDYEGLPKRRLILGSHRWQEGRATIIVEGLFAYAHMVELGMEERVNVGALLGSVLTAEKAGVIRINGGSTALFLDNDAAGEAGIFGSILPSGDRDSDGAVHLLQGHVPVLIPSWPCWEVGGLHIGGDHGPGDPKIDPDQLTREDVDSMLDNTDIWGYDTV